MLEIIHDIAPAAELFFAGINAPTLKSERTWDVQDAFIDSIDWLIAQDVDIIVDDQGIVVEPWLRDGPIASHVSNIVNDSRLNDGKGILYVSAAGNFGNRAHYQETLNAKLIDPGSTIATQLAQLNDNDGNLHLHQFGDDESSVDSFLLPISLTNREAYRFDLHWSDDFHAKTNDLQLVLLDSQYRALKLTGFHPFGQSAKEIKNSGAPWLTGNEPISRLLGTDPFGRGFDGYIAIRVNKLDESPPPIIELMKLTGASQSFGEFGNDADRIFGHAAVPNVLTVGAVHVHDLPSLKSPGSSQGPTTVVASSGQIEVRPSLDVIAAARVEVSGHGQSQGIFGGTSAAAPHVAAIAALLWEYDGDVSATEVRQAILASGEQFPIRSEHLGYGLVNAQRARAALDDDPGRRSAGGQGRRLVAATTAEPRGLELLQLRGIELEHLASAQDFLAGNLSGTDDVVRLRIVETEGTRGPFRTEFGLDVDDVGGLKDLDAQGRLTVETRPIFDVRLGLDGNGFFLDSQSWIGAEVEAIATGSGQYGPLAAKVSGTVDARPILSFNQVDADADSKLYVDELLASVSDLAFNMDDTSADLMLRLENHLLDYVDADGDPTNNTEHGGDAFRFETRARLSASIATDAGFEFKFGNFEILNPDVDIDDRPDFTLAVFKDNLIALSKDVLRGERLIFGADLSGAFDSVVSPLTANPIGEWLELQEKVDSFLAESEDVDAGGEEDESIFDVSVPDGLFDSLLNVVENGFGDEPIDLARLSINLGAIPLDVVDDNVSFDLQSILPDSTDVVGRAGIENAFLDGQVVFGVDTSLNPLYLLTEPDVTTPGLATTITGGFDLFVNVTGHPLGNGVLTLDNADARVSPKMTIDFEDLGVGKMRIGSDLSQLGNVKVTLADEQFLEFSADSVGSRSRAIRCPGC